MNKYFYSDGQQSFGPYGLDELRSMNVVAPTTKVWCQGMADWADASTVAEMGSWFAATPPPVKVVIQGNERQTIEIHTNQGSGQTTSAELLVRPSSWLAPSIIATIFCCLPFGIVGIVYATKVESRYNQGDYAGARAASKAAQMWSWISIGAGLLFGLLWFTTMAFSAFRF